MRLVQLDGVRVIGDFVGHEVIIDIFEDADGRQWVLLMEVRTANNAHGNA